MYFIIGTYICNFSIYIYIFIYTNILNIVDKSGIIPTWITQIPIRKYLKIN